MVCIVLPKAILISRRLGFKRSFVPQYQCEWNKEVIETIDAKQYGWSNYCKGYILFTDIWFEPTLEDLKQVTSEFITEYRLDDVLVEPDWITAN